jgi:hypothetical protein
MRRMSWLVALLLVCVAGCGGHSLWIGSGVSESGGSWFEATNDAGYVGDLTGDYRTKH